MAIDYSDLPLAKGESHWLKGRKRRKAVMDHEERQKTLVRKRDRICRWPKCPRCTQWHPPLEVAHIVAKGMGGDHRTRSTSDQMLLLDRLTHQEHEQHRLEVRPVTSTGTDGPCEFWAQGKDGWSLVAREVAPFVYARD